MKSNYKIEIILSLLGFSLLYILLSNLSFIDKEYSFENNKYMFITVNYQKFPVYKGKEFSENKGIENLSESPFNTNNNVDINQLTFYGNTIGSQNTVARKPLASQYNIIKPQETTNDASGRSHMGALFANRNLKKKGNNYSGFAGSSAFNPISTYDRPFFARSASNDLILIDPSTDPKDVEKISVGGGPSILVFFLILYVIHKNKRNIFVYVKKKQVLLKIRFKAIQKNRILH